jgi:hypothetical protein
MKEPKLKRDENSERTEAAETKINEVIGLLAGKRRALDSDSKDDVNESHAIRLYIELLHGAKEAIKEIDLP